MRLLSQALAAISKDEHTKKGLDSEPLALLMLLLDDSTLDGQTPMGRHLLSALSHLGISDDNADRRQQLLLELKSFFLASDEYWEGLHGQSLQIEKRFDDFKKGKKDEVTEAFERQAVEKGCISSCASVLQIVYANGARNHAVLSRSVFGLFVSFFIHP